MTRKEQLNDMIARGYITKKNCPRAFSKHNKLAKSEVHALYMDMVAMYGSNTIYGTIMRDPFVGLVRYNNGRTVKVD